MRRKAVVVLLAALSLVSIKMGTGHGEDTAILTGNHPREAETASMGNADPNQPLSMEIHFAVRNEAELNQLLAEQQNPSSPNYRRWLATGEYDRRFGPRQSDIDAVADWLKSEGFTVESASDGSIKFAGTVAQAQRTFSVRIARFGDGSAYANVSDPSIPARFAGVISNVSGLDNMTHVMPGGPRRIVPKPVR